MNHLKKENKNNNINRDILFISAVLITYVLSGIIINYIKYKKAIVIPLSQYYKKIFIITIVSLIVKIPLFRYIDNFKK